MMADKSWLRRRIEKALTKALTRAYETVRVDPQRFLLELRAAHGLPVTSFQGMYSVEPPVLDTVAEQVIHSAMKIAAAEGAGFERVRPLAEQLLVVRHVPLPHAVHAHAANHVERRHHLDPQGQAFGK